MNDLKQHMCQRLRAAQKWLMKAEQSFDKQHDVRAELDLMLAQAELQHVKETKRPWQWRCKYAVLRHGMALACAMFLAIAAGGVYWWNHKPEPAVPVPLAGQVTVSAESKNQAKPTPTANAMPQESNQPRQSDVVKQQAEIPVPKEKEQPKPAESLHQVEQTSKVQEFRSAEPSAVLSPDEMQKLVRAAGKSLRGQ